jgi:hypothetical protein
LAQGRRRTKFDKRAQAAGFELGSIFQAESRHPAAATFRRN